MWFRLKSSRSSDDFLIHAPQTEVCIEISIPRGVELGYQLLDLDETTLASQDKLEVSDPLRATFRDKLYSSHNLSKLSITVHICVA